MEKSGSTSVSHNDSADAIFMGCCWNISLPWRSPVKNRPAVASKTTQQPRTVAGRYIDLVPGSTGLFWDRTSHHALTAATKVPATNRAPMTVWVKATNAVLLV